MHDAKLLRLSACDARCKEAHIGVGEQEEPERRRGDGIAAKGWLGA